MKEEASEAGGDDRVSDPHVPVRPLPFKPIQLAEVDSGVEELRGLVKRGRHVRERERHGGRRRRRREEAATKSAGVQASGPSPYLNAGRGTTFRRGGALTKPSLAPPDSTTTVHRAENAGLPSAPIVRQTYVMERQIISAKLTLPRELLGIVFSCLDQPSIPPVLACTKTFHDVGLPHLYSDLKDLSIRRTIGCMLSLRHHRTACEIVRELHLNFSSLTLPSKNLLVLIRRALLRLSKLKHLSLSWCEHRHVNTPSPTWVLRDMPFTLHHFETSFRIDNNLASLLEHQPKLEELEIRTRPSHILVRPADFSLAEGSLPNLRVLRAVHLSETSLSKIIAGRPLHYISVSLIRQRTNLFRILSSGAVPLRRLSIINTSGMSIGAVLSELAGNTPALEALHLVDVDIFSGSEVRRGLY
jgi:hypothetical protein